MNFEQFNQVALDDPLTLMVAMELLLQNGRGMIQSRQASELVSDCQERLGTLFTEGKLREIVDVCQGLAGLDSKTLVDYIHCGSLEIKNPVPIPVMRMRAAVSMPGQSVLDGNWGIVGS